MNNRTGPAATIDDFSQALLVLDRLQAGAILSNYCTDRNPHQAVEEVVIPSLESIGRRFESGELALSQIYMGGLICEETVEEVLSGRRPQKTRDSGKKIGLAVLEDQHALGKKIVQLTLRSAGFEIRDYGVGISVSTLVERVLAEEIAILMVSVLMLPAALRIGEIRRELDAAGAAGKAVRLLVGGAPFRFDENLWREVGADAFARNASETIGVLESMLAGHNDSGSEPEA